MDRWRSIGPLAVLVGLLMAGAWEAGGERGDRVTGGMLMGAGLIVLGAWLSGEIREELRNADLARARKARRALQVEQERQERLQVKPVEEKPAPEAGYTGTEDEGDFEDREL